MLGAVSGFSVREIVGFWVREEIGRRVYMLQSSTQPVVALRELSSGSNKAASSLKVSGRQVVGEKSLPWLPSH